jgi:hypothetical protein
MRVAKGLIDRDRRDDRRRLILLGGKREMDEGEKGMREMEEGVRVEEDENG